MTATGFCADAALAVARDLGTPGDLAVSDGITRAELSALHLIAAWDGAGHLAALQPPRRPNGRHCLKRLVQLLEQPVRAAKRAPPLTVWHCSVRNHPTDRTLSDQQWQHIAAEIVAGVGLAPHGDPAAVRWIAVRHADDHIHIVATLVRQDGRTESAWNDWPKAQAVARDLEERYGLYRVGPVDHTSHCRPTAAEQNKAERHGHREVPRDRLRREVRAVAAAAGDETEFFHRYARRESSSGSATAPSTRTR